MGQQRLQLSPDALTSRIDPYTQQSVLTGCVDVWMPDPPLTLNLRDLKQVGCLSEQQLNCIKQTHPESPNVLLFVHGYNVGLGAYGKVLYTDDRKSSTCQQVEFSNGEMQFLDDQVGSLYFSEQDATIYRSIHQQQHFARALSDLAINDDSLNGDGAHNWWLHMEYNLNKAAGFRGFDYWYQSQQPQYTRIVNIAWSGDPASPLDYMAVEPIAAATAEHLQHIIEQLLAHQIEINVVAHSAGNIVVLKLMQLLGMQQRYQQCLNRVFMWQPAMPNNVLSPAANREDDSLTGFWRTQQAHLSARKIYVLYSHHDNILGPIPLTLQGQKEARLHEKWRTPGGGKGMAITALSLDIIDQQLGVPNALKSCYHMAHLFHAPFNTLLFDDDFRETLYADWYRQYAAHLSRTTHCSDLADQVRLVENEYPKAFNDLALFLSLYAAIKHDGLFAFLVNMKNDQRLSKFLLALPPLLAEQVVKNVNHVAAAAIDHRSWAQVYTAMSHLAREHVRFSYVKSLWQVFMHKQVRFLRKAVCDINTFLFSKIHDLLLHDPFFYLKKHVQLDMDVWSYLLDHFKTSRKSEKSTRQKGYEIARRGAEMAAFVITVLNTPGAEPRPALGYTGVVEDQATRQLMDDGKIVCINQTAYLFHHSAMKVVKPTDTVFERVYQDVILGDEQVHFGRWK